MERYLAVEYIRKLNLKSLGERGRRRGGEGEHHQQRTHTTQTPLLPSLLFSSLNNRKVFFFSFSYFLVLSIVVLCRCLDRIVFDSRAERRVGLRLDLNLSLIFVEFVALIILVVTINSR